MAVNLFQRHRVYNCTNNILSHRLPAGLCYLCDAGLEPHDYLLCRECILDLPFIRFSCPLCALPGQSDAVCADCLNRKRLIIDQSMSVFRYEYPISQMIVALKFHARQPLAGFFARMLASMAAGGRIARPELFVPVPLHSLRLAQRGFNQSLLIAKHLSRLTNVPIDKTCCWRVRPTRMQSGLSAAARRRNLKGAFSANYPRGKAPIHVAIVDDVVTTAATVTEMANSLAVAGVQRIDVWSCCRSVRGPT